jgi:hypothetical protein
MDNNDDQNSSQNGTDNEIINKKILHFLSQTNTFKIKLEKLKKVKIDFCDVDQLKQELKEISNLTLEIVNLSN